MRRRLLPIVIAALGVGLGATGVKAAETPHEGKPSITVFPVSTVRDQFSDQLAQRVGIVVATFLERAGVEDLEVADARFSPPETDDVDEIAQAFAGYVGKKPIHTDYAVFAQFVGTPQTGVEAIRTVVVSRAGKVVFAESAGKEQLQKSPLRPKDPMTCSAFVGRRLQELRCTTCTWSSATGRAIGS